MKKLYAVFLSLSVIFSLAINAYAVEDNSIPASADLTPRQTGEFFHYNAETGETLSEEGELVTFEDVILTLPGNSNESDATRTTEAYIVRSGLKRVSGNQFVWFFNLDCPTSPLNKPNLKLTAQLKGSFTTGSGTYSNVGNSVYHEYTTNLEYGVDYTWTVPAKTGYYYTYYTITDYDHGYHDDGITSTALSNRTGHAWVYEFSDVGKYLPLPRADWVKGAVHQRPNGLANTYYATYTQLTGITLDRSKYDVHHIQPLAYGGDNSYANLIHLPKALHTSVTGWFSGY